MKIQSSGDIIFLSAPIWKSTDIIATDSETGKSLTAAELVDQKLLVPYIGSNAEEVYFYGQYNDNNHWDGNCILNVYQNNNLILVTEAEYNDGVLLNYKQAVPSGNSTLSWIISDRNNKGNFNSGDSWKYTTNEHYVKNFTIETVNQSDILYVDDLGSLINTALTEYYHGNTSNGYYNDTTNEAYLVSYTKDGKVKTLYKGNFKNGKFDDTTGNAWEIVFDDSNNVNKYFYYRGVFTNGVRKEKISNNNYVTQEQINEIIDGIDFNCVLDWVD